jgi:tetratricopeptide (TPR) repeat protein
VLKKLFFILLFIIFSFAVIYFFLFNDSYKKSLQARVYFGMGEYDKAYMLSNEAYLKDPYNRMALTILNASKASLKYEKYIKDAKKYLGIIEKISSKKSITPGELARIKLICEVMTGQYEKLKPIVIDDGDLVEKSTKEYKKFKKIYEELFKK